MKRSVLITGAAGRIGQMLTAAWAHRFALSLLDIRPLRGRRYLPSTIGDASNLACVRPLCTGVDTIVHLAGLASPLSDWRDLHRHNVRTAWTVLRAARHAGCRRVVFASSVMIDIDPALAYSRAKCLGEQLGQRYAARGDLSIICLRVGHVLAAGDGQLWPGDRRLPYAVMQEDAIDGFTLAVEAAPSLRFGVFTIISANRRAQGDVSDARAELGYAPRLDAFACADARYRSAWGLLKRTKLWLRSLS